MLAPDEKLSPTQRRFRTRLLELRPALDRASVLVTEFFRLARERRSDDREAWLAAVEASEVRELVRFGNSLRQDFRAVKNGLTLPWSNGPTEGQVNRLQLVKRSMYGRASFAVLRARVLPRKAAG